MKGFRYGFMIVLATVCVILDQVSKYLVLENIPLYRGFNVIPGLFDLVHVRNRGAAFGFLNRTDIDWQLWLFLGTTLLAIIIIFNMARTSPWDRLLFSGFGLILGGAAGNFIDRVRFGNVVDFLDFYIGTWHWPVFNVADVAICIGAFLVGWFYLFRLPDKDPEEKK